MHVIYLYIDPGSGSLMVQAILGVALGVGVFFKTIRYKVMSLFGRHKGEAADDDEEDEITSGQTGKAE